MTSQKSVRVGTNLVPRAGDEISDTGRNVFKRSKYWSDRKITAMLSPSIAYL